MLEKKNGDEHQNLIDITNYKRFCVNSGQQVCYRNSIENCAFYSACVFYYSYRVFYENLHNHFPLVVKFNSISCAEAEEVK